MPNEVSEPDYGNGTVKIDSELAWKLRFITHHSGQTVAEILDPLIREPINERFRKVAGDLNRLAASAAP